MEIKNTKNNNVYVSEEEKTLNWNDVQDSFKKTFGSEIYNSWLQKLSLVKEYNDYLILGVPTRFFGTSASPIVSGTSFITKTGSCEGGSKGSDASSPAGAISTLIVFVMLDPLAVAVTSTS